jgi:molecular chaperone IbpA
MDKKFLQNGGIDDTLRRRLFYSKEESSYPLYNIEKLYTQSDHGEYYRISVAVAGFRKEDLDVTLCDFSLRITAAHLQQDDRVFLHKGISSRGFDKVFQLNDSMSIEHSFLRDGILNIDLLRNIAENKNITRISILTEEDILKLK